MADPLIVAPVVEVRQQLSRLLARFRRERARASAQALVSVQAEGLEPSQLGHAVMDRVVEGSLTYAEAIAELDRHHRSPRAAR